MISEKGKEFIRSWEGCRLTAYDDGVGVWTIGYGHTRGVKPGDVITQEQANEWFNLEVDSFANRVAALITVDVEPHQMDALVSLAYNIGVGALSKSTLLRMLNVGDVTGAGQQFDVWNKGGGQVMPGLVRRRAAERKMFEYGVYENNR